eukprot:8666977-Prorocentrum_lima.AAC.1
MTSSLVGSEMCIRDRERKFCWQREIKSLSLFFVLVSRSRLLPLGCDTVSYTHLTLPTICSV